ncbi:hypothetical protein [Polaribacter gangjinensis]|uniref:DUF4440 domain-containing protein n=1 Tax=Polaribacter gangjinensis TaxID=574710 RepID=A0A2S7WAC6_9FLAO|nr:hypothetical protein [Polaribacter gangjinensis]PQJ74579.1 hypothetical protein BTO13_04585 [Polaribacter gangjinensis]
MRKRTFLITLLMINSITFSQTKKFKDIAEVQAFTKKTANDFLNMNFEVAFNDIKPYWALSEIEVDSIRIKTESYKDYFISNFGKSVDVIKVKETNLKNVLYKEVYAIRFENFILRMRISFYQNNIGWAVKGFEWDDDIYAELD